MKKFKNGSVLRTFSREEGASKLSFRFDHDVEQASWFAIRISGTKIGELEDSPSLAHTGPIYVTLKNLPGLESQPAAAGNFAVDLVRSVLLPRHLVRRASECLSPGRLPLGFLVLPAGVNLRLHRLDLGLRSQNGSDRSRAPSRTPIGLSLA